MATVSKATNDLIQKAVDDNVAAAEADATHAVAVQRMQAANDEEAASLQTSVQVHKTALASAHVAIEALTKELGVTA